MALLQLTFDAEVWEWRGPAPFHFLTVPHDEAAAIRDIATHVTYGWGVIPVQGHIGNTTFSTSLFPRDGGYAVPLKDAVRKPEHIGIGDLVTVTLAIG